MGLLNLLGKAAGVGLAPLTGGASLTPLLIGAAAGAGKHFLVDKPAEKRSRQQSADMMRVSPWSHITPTAIKSAPGLVGSTLAGAAMGATVGGALPGAAAGAATNVAGAAPSLGVAGKYSGDIAKMGADAASSAGSALQNIGAVPQLPNVPTLAPPAFGSSLYGAQKQSPWMLAGR